MSTIELSSLLNNMISLHETNTIFDLGCGIGAQSIFLAKLFPTIQFIGLDYNSSHIDFAQKKATEEKIINLRFEKFDVLKPVLRSFKQFQQGDSGIISVHTLCCFKNFEPFFNTILKFNPNWFVCNSLFYEGPLEVLIHIRDLNNQYSSRDSNPDSDFNIFSKERVRSHLKNFGYEVNYSDFYPAKQLPKPSDNKRGTYTISTDFHPRTQFSGPVHLPWSFLIATKI